MSDTVMPPAPPPQGSRPSGRPSTGRTLKNYNSHPEPPPGKRFTRKHVPLETSKSVAELPVPPIEKTPPEPPINPIMPPEPPTKRFVRKAYSAAPQEPGKVLLNDEHDTLIYDNKCGCYTGKFIDGKQVVLKILKVAKAYNAMDIELQEVFRNIYQISSHASYSYYYDYQLLNTVNKFKENDFDINKYEEEYIRDIKNQIYKEPEDCVFNPAFLHKMSGDSTQEKIDSVVKHIIEAQTAGPPPKPEPPPPATPPPSNPRLTPNLKSVQYDEKTLGEELKNDNIFKNEEPDEEQDFEKDMAEPVIFKTPDPKDSHTYYRGKISKSSGVDIVNPVIFDDETLANQYNAMNAISQTIYRELISQIQRNGSSLKNDVLAEKVMKTVEIFEILKYNIEYYARLYGELSDEERYNVFSPHGIVEFAPSQDRTYRDWETLMKFQLNQMDPAHITGLSYSAIKDKAIDVVRRAQAAHPPGPPSAAPPPNPRSNRRFVPVKDSLSGEYKINVTKTFGTDFTKAEDITNQKLGPIIFNNSDEGYASKYNKMDGFSQTLFHTLYNKIILKRGYTDNRSELQITVFNTIDILKELNYDIQWYAYNYNDNVSKNPLIMTPQEMVKYGADEEEEDMSEEIKFITQIQNRKEKPDTPNPIKLKLPAIKNATKGGKKTKKRIQKKRCTQKRRKQKKC